MKRKRKPTSPGDPDWDKADWMKRCAWCAARIRSHQPVFGISVRLHEAAFQEVTPGDLAPMLLPALGKVVPMIVVTEDSPARQEGKDAIFQLCSESCAEALQQALRAELG